MDCHTLVSVGTPVGTEGGYDAASFLQAESSIPLAGKKCNFVSKPWGGLEVSLMERKTKRRGLKVPPPLCLGPVTVIT